MKKDNFYNDLDVNKLNEYIKLAKDNNKRAQKIIYDYFVILARPIAYKNHYNAKKLGLDFNDLMELVIKAYMTCLRKFEPSKADLTRYFRFIYSKTIKDEFRNQLTKTHKLLLNSIGKEEDYFNTDKNNYMMHLSEDYFTTIKIDDSIYRLLVIDNVLKLNKTEHEVLDKYAKGFKITEINKMLGIKYHKTSNILGDILVKAKSYLKSSYPDLYASY
ncbi:MAG: hypothetical protein ACTTID_02145 [Bacillales bacterium]